MLSSFLKITRLKNSALLGDKAQNAIPLELDNMFGIEKTEYPLECMVAPQKNRILVKASQPHPCD